MLINIDKSNTLINLIFTYARIVVICFYFVKYIMQFIVKKKLHFFCLGNKLNIVIMQSRILSRKTFYIIEMLILIFVIYEQFFLLLGITSNVFNGIFPCIAKYFL